MGRNKDDNRTAGPCISIDSSGVFRVGEYYVDAKGALRGRYSSFKADSTTEKMGY